MSESFNDSAADLWSQIFTRVAAHPGAAINDPEHDRAADEAVMRAGFVAAGWGEDEINAITYANNAAEAAAPRTSVGVSRGAEARHALLCDDVEAEMARQGMVSQSHVARGIEPRVGPFAAKVGVIMTEQSIVTVGSFTYRFCGLIAKAFIRTLMLNPWLWESDSYSTDRGEKLLRNQPDILMYWVQIYLSFAVTGTNATTPFKASTKQEVILVEQVARAMEIFLVAHEYGHHHLGHGRDIGADSHAEEFAADQFALRIGRPLGYAEMLANPYLAGGAGGVILLKSLDTLRHFETFLGGGHPVGDTHPPVSDRISRFDTVAMLEPVNFRKLKGFRTASDRVMELVHGTMTAVLEGIPAEISSSLSRIRGDLAVQMP